ncbi:hypothetical protein [Devosia limi]|uniref:hypothetical protein n=1 Tax=Devosia limi TaxID=288995 RepID=UPI0011604A5A|nr:hypothetical protein [Devosia limi]
MKGRIMGSRLLTSLALLTLAALSTPAMAMSEGELKEMTAFIINSNGHLCADVTDIRPLRLDGQFEVTCIEYRGGSGTVRYIMNAKNGTAFPA